MVTGQTGRSGHLVVLAAMEERSTEQDSAIDQPLFMVEEIVLVTAWRHKHVIYKLVQVRDFWLQSQRMTPLRYNTFEKYVAIN